MYSGFSSSSSSSEGDAGEYTGEESEEDNEKEVRRSGCEFDHVNISRFVYRK